MCYPASQLPDHPMVWLAPQRTSCTQPANPFLAALLASPCNVRQQSLPTAVALTPRRRNTRPCPVNVLKAVQNCPTVCRIYCATANPTAVVVGKDGGERRGILGVLDGFQPLGVEDEAGA